MGQGKVVIRQLKRFAAERLPSESLLRHIILTEPDEIDALSFLAKLETWLMVAQRELG